MPSLVLDKSVVVAAKNGVLRSLRESQFSFVLTDTLLYEISTERLEDRGSMSQSRADRLEGRVAASLAKAREAGGEWVETSSALRREVVHGQSARSGPRLVMAESFSLQDIHDALGEARDACIAHDVRVGRLASVPHAPRDEQDFKRIRGMDRKSLFEYLDAVLSSPSFLERIRKDTREGFTKVAEKRDLKVSPAFAPDRGWLCYGVELANRAYLPWKFWRVGDQQADTRKPANPFFDNLYIASLAIGDGIISCDRDLLRLAWVCWPEKRDHVFRYDTGAHSPRVFRPDWL